MNEVLLTMEQARQGLRHGIVVLIEDGRHAFYTANQGLAAALAGRDEDDDMMMDISAGDESNGPRAYNLLTREVEELLLPSFGGIVKRVASVGKPGENLDETKYSVEGFVSLLIMGEQTGAVSLSARLTRALAMARSSYTDLGLKAEPLLRLPVFVQTRTDDHGKTVVTNLYLLRQ